jgi:predicted ATP-grasp superfamily ATP-dependent carboligase
VPARSTGLAAAPKVAIFDVELPTGIAFIRSLARAGVPYQCYSHLRWPVGRVSRFAGPVKPAPSPERVDEFVEWLDAEHRRGAFQFVAPTSDYVSFACAEAAERIPGFVGVGTPSEAIRRCLFKDRFAAAMEAVGFPVPESATPTTLDEALAAAEKLGYPVLLKPRSHAGIGIARGRVATSPDSLRELFTPYQIGRGRSLAIAHDPGLALPMLQRYHPPERTTVISLSGCLDRDGEPVSLSACAKHGQWPRRLGTGTIFEPHPLPAFTESAIAAVKALLERGIFELEVLVDRETGEHWAIDLNPRAFGQISLDVALGHDLPVLWYRDMSGCDVTAAPPRRRPPEYWQQAVPVHTATLLRVLRGPGRLAAAKEAIARAARPHVGAVYDHRDPAPGLVFAWAILRNPRRLIRTMLKDTEAV